MRDKFEQVAWDGDCAVAVMGNPAFFDYELVDLRGDVNDWQDKTGRGMYFLGTVGIVNGQPTHELEPLDATATAYVGQLYSAHVTRALEAQRVADDTAWLERYYARLYAPPRD